MNFENISHYIFEKYYRLIVFLLLLVFIAICAKSVYYDSATTDEKDHIAFGEQIIDGVAEHASMQRMPITALNVIPFDIFKSDITYSEQYKLWIYRLPSIIFSTILGLYIFIWSNKLYGTKGGFLSLYLFVFCPNTVAHSRLVTTDMYCSLLMFLAVFSFVQYLRSKTLVRLFTAAIIMGIAQLTKHTALILFPVLLIILFLQYIPSKLSENAKRITVCLKQLKTAVVHGLAYAMVVVFIINAGYGFKGSGSSWKEHTTWLTSHQLITQKQDSKPDDLKNLLSKVPLPLPSAYVEALIIGQFYNETGKGHGPIYLLGDLSTLGWWYYFPLDFMLKFPLPSLLLFAISLYLIKKNKQLNLNSDETYMVLTASIIFIFFCFFCTAQLGIRYLLPVLPFIYVLSGQVVKFKPVKHNTLWKSCFVMLLIWLPVSFFSFYPHFISYFNELCPDRLRLYKYLADSNIDWGQSDNYLINYLNEHQDKKIYVNPPNPVTGTVIVNINRLVGVFGSPTTYAWLRNNYSPVDHVAYSWLVYEIHE